MYRVAGVPVHRVVLVAVAVGVAVALFTTAATSDAAFGAYNGGWDGTSELRAQAATDADVEVARETTVYGRVPPNETVAFVLSPVTGYDIRDRERVRRFVRRGGTAVVAEDFGPHTNELLRGVGATARVDGQPLRDVRHFYPGRAMPVARNVSEHPLTAGVGTLSLNYATAVEPNDATVLVRTSEYAYVDRNHNETIDYNESLASYPVATVESVGDGRVVVVGDPSVVTNSMNDLAGNRAFVDQLLAGHSHVVLDHSHAEPVPPLAVAVIVLRDSKWVQVGVGFLGVAGVAVGRAVLDPASRDG